VQPRTAEIDALRAWLDAERELRRRQVLRLAKLERRLGIDSTDSGTPSSSERIGAEEAQRALQQSVSTHVIPQGLKAGLGAGNRATGPSK